MSFNTAFNLLMQLEGGIVTDSGGLTKYGISQNQYPHVDIANLTLAAAECIYLRDYWQKYNCNLLPEDLATCLFCVGVDQGMGTDIQILQKVLNTTADGIIGNQTLSAIGSRNLKDVIINFMAECAVRYSDCASFPVDRLGWMRRLFIIMDGINAN